MGTWLSSLLTKKALRGLTAAAGLSLLSACASAPPQGGAIPLAERVLAPAGLLDFCTRDEADCRTAADTGVPAVLTKERWRELNEVNYTFNHAIRPITDLALYHKVEYWQYPDGAGDCEDFALAKRRALIARGWPAQSLVFATARTQAGELHAVLIANTDHGDLVLDNAHDFVELWSEMPYRWVARQMPGEMLAWRRAGTGTSLVATASLE